jgi:hypothetical protein
LELKFFKKTKQDIFSTNSTATAYRIRNQIAERERGSKAKQNYSSNPLTGNEKREDMVSIGMYTCPYFEKGKLVGSGFASVDR